MESSSSIKFALLEILGDNMRTIPLWFKPKCLVPKHNTDCQFYTKYFLLQEIGKFIVGLSLFPFGIRSAKCLLLEALLFFFSMCTAVKYIAGTLKDLTFIEVLLAVDVRNRNAL